MNHLSHLFYKSSPSVLVCLAAAGVWMTQVPSVQAVALVQSSEHAALIHPDSSSSSVGNELAEIFDNNSGVLTGNVTAQAQLQVERGGTDFNGTSGNSKVDGSNNSSMGLLQSTLSATANSTAPNPLAPFPHGGATLGSFGRFEDLVQFSNPNYLGSIPVTLHLDLVWNHSYDLGHGGANFAQDWAIAQMGLEWFGNVTSYNLVRSDAASPTLQLSVSLSGNALLNSPLHLFGNLDVQAGVSLNPRGTVSAPFADASAMSAAIASYTFEAPEGTVLTSESGHDYLRRAPATNPVPDSASNGVLMGCALSVLGVMRRIRSGRGSAAPINP